MVETEEVDMEVVGITRDMVGVGTTRVEDMVEDMVEEEVIKIRDITEEVTTKDMAEEDTIRIKDIMVVVTIKDTEEDMAVVTEAAIDQQHQHQKIRI